MLRRSHGMRNEIHALPGIALQAHSTLTPFSGKESVLMKAGEPRRMFSSHIPDGLHLVAHPVGINVPRSPGLAVLLGAQLISKQRGKSCFPVSDGFMGEGKTTLE